MASFQRWPRIRSAGVDSGRILRFFRTGIRSRSQKFVKNGDRIRSHFLVKAVAGICVVFVYVIAWVSNMNRIRILKFETISFRTWDPDSKILEQEWSWSQKMWLRPPLLPLCTTCRKSFLLASLSHHFARSSKLEFKIFFRCLKQFYIAFFLFLFLRCEACVWCAPLYQSCSFDAFLHKLVGMSSFDFLLLLLALKYSWVLEQIMMHWTLLGGRNYKFHILTVQITRFTVTQRSWVEYVKTPGGALCL